MAGTYLRPFMAGTHLRPLLFDTGRALIRRTVAHHRFGSSLWRVHSSDLRWTQPGAVVTAAYVHRTHPTRPGDFELCFAGSLRWSRRCLHSSGIPFESFGPAGLRLRLLHPKKTAQPRSMDAISHLEWPIDCGMRQRKRAWVGRSLRGRDGVRRSDPPVQRRVLR